MCCIVAKYFNDIGWVVVKNRDRNYIPEVRILEENGLTLMTDMTTYYQEGVNSYGVGVVSSSLMVIDDEKEYRRKMLAGGKKSKDGERIVTGLKAGDIESVKSELVAQKLTGHTFISNKDELWVLEGAKDDSGKYNYSMRNINNSDIIIRTNHGIDLVWAGYRTGFKMLSSARRYSYGKVCGLRASSKEQLIELMQKQFDADWGLNICRRSDKPFGMMTVGQVVISNGQVEHISIDQSS